MNFKPEIPTMNFKPEIKSKEEIAGNQPRYESIVKYMVQQHNLVTVRPDQSS